jgi:5-(carboxyamino)imidazole ribonucleotide mutase
LSIVQMPRGVPVATFAIGAAGAANAALYALSILAVTEGNLAQQLVEYREQQRQHALGMTLPPQS